MVVNKVGGRVYSGNDTVGRVASPGIGFDGVRADGLVLRRGSGDRGNGVDERVH